MHTVAAVSSSPPRQSLTLVVAFLVGSALLGWLARKEEAAKAKEKKKKDDGTSTTNISSLSPEEEWIKSSIESSMPPANRMGITVDKLNLTTTTNRATTTTEATSQGSLSLSMPLLGNTNIHGSAFAGSLYSLSVLCAWYTLVCFFRSLGIDTTYSVVVKSAEISYLRPVIHMDRVVATSILPSPGECRAFVTKLKETGKTTLSISGKINVKTPTTTTLTRGNQQSSSTSTSTATGGAQREEKTAVEYKALLCAFKPRR